MHSTDWIKTFHRVDWGFVYSALQKFGCGGKFNYIIKATFTNIQSKIINGLLSDPLCEEFARGVHSQCSFTLLLLSYLPVSLIMIKGKQIGDHEIKMTTPSSFYLRDITCLNRIHVTLKIYEDASSSKINFSKVEPYGA